VTPRRARPAPRLVSAAGRLPIALGVVLGALVAACGAGGALSMDPRPRAFTPSDYERIRDRWTREERGFAFSRLEDTLHVSATFQSWEQRWAYVVRYASDYSLDTAERTRLLRATLDDARAHHRFFVSLAGNSWRESDLTGERSAWRVVLVDDRGTAHAPTELERVARPGPGDRGYYRVTPFRRVFRVAFPARRADGTPTIAPDARRVTLRFTGPQGAVDLVWELSPTEAAAGGEAR
jgi:hypothetical protein